jgi:GT2 family glycosyltransferase
MINTLGLSVIIPSHNRLEALRRCLKSLAQQDLDPSDFEVIVVDDGAFISEGNIREDLPIQWTVIRQPASGATEARNRGAASCKGDILVFMDDDVTLASDALRHMRTALLRGTRILVTARIKTRIAGQPTPFYDYLLAEEGERSSAELDQDLRLPGVRCNTQVLGVRKVDFLSLGKFQDPTGGWPNWDDVDFGFRAQQSGYDLIQLGRVEALHWDWAASAVQEAAGRWARAGHSAVRLIERYPALLPQLPMLADKVPIVWGIDPAPVVARKLARRFASTGRVIGLLSRAALTLERYRPTSPVLRVLYRWMIGGAIAQGYRSGLRQVNRPRSADRRSVLV